MKKTVIASAAAAGALVAGLAGAGAAGATTPQSATSASLSAQDKAFIASNGHTDLAEITLATYIRGHIASYRNAYKLASHTGADHAKVEKALTALAKVERVSLPKAPDAMQKKAATEVKKARYTAYRFFLVEIAGHEQSIAATNKEIADGSNRAVVAFAKAYLPIAEDHLMMAKSDLHWWETHRSAG